MAWWEFIVDGKVIAEACDANDAEKKRLALLSKHGDNLKMKVDRQEVDQKWVLSQDRVWGDKPTMSKSQ